MKKFPWRSALYLLVLTYLVIDLKCCNGPLRRKISDTRPSSEIVREKAKKYGWVAIVNREPVTKGQLQLAVSRYLYQRGKDWTELSDQSKREIKRATLRRLIDDILIRHYADGENFAAPAEEIDAFIEAWEKQFPTAESLESRSELQGLTKEDRDLQLGRIWSRKRWLEKRIAPGIAVTDDDIKNWLEEHYTDKNPYLEPEKIRARHIFISTVEEDTEAQEEQINAARKRIIEDGEDFAEVAREISEDPRTRNRGGDLNWFSRSRVPEDFSTPVFAQETGELGEPFKTKIGWHIVEVTDRQEARELTFEEVRAEVRIHLLNEQKRETINQLLGKLRKVANIVVFQENL